MIKRKKAVLKISFIILALIIIGFLVVYASGVFGDVTIMGTHDADVTLSPNLLSCDEGIVTFSVNIFNNGPNAIKEVRIYNASYNGYFHDIPPHEDFSCGDAPTGWILYDKHPTFPYCQYEALSASYYIEAGEDLDFTFDAKVIDECNYTWGIETYDINLAWQSHEPEITVDCTAPVTDMWPLEPKKEENGVTWIDGITTIKLQARDVGEHDSGIEKIYWRNTLLESEEACWSEEYCLNETETRGSGEWNETENNPVWFQKDEESCHLLEYYSVDGVGNEEDVNKNCFFVDLTAPKITKEIGVPEITDDGVGISYDLTTTGDAIAEIVDGGDFDGDIRLQADLITNYPPSNEARIYIPVDSFRLKNIYTIMWDAYVETGYMPHVDVILDFDEDGTRDDALVFEYAKVDPNDCDDAPYPTGSVDTFDDKGFVDGNAYAWLSSGPPGPCGDPSFIYGSLADWKAGTVDPSVDGDTKVIAIEIEVDGWIAESEAYVDLIKLNDQDMRILHWVTQNTSVTFECYDQQPHPSEDEKVCYKVSFDDPQRPYLTEDYCGEFGGDMEDGWCCEEVYESDNQYQFNFMEDSIHDLVYYCEDAVEKKSPTYLQYYKVDDTPPIITKEMIGTDHLGDCPPNPEPSDDVCYVRDDGNNGVLISVEDNETYGHAVGREKCYYEVWLDDRLVDYGNFLDYKEIVFGEDSTHTLKIWCEDDLGNLLYDEEVFLVDSEPPETIKRYGEPFVERYGMEWINLETLIYLNASDEKVGVNKTYWRNFLIEDSGVADMVCGNPREYCHSEFYYQFINPETPWNEYTEPFNKQEESCHIIEYYSVDKLGNEEELKWQCVFVDNTAPESIKEHEGPFIEDEGFSWVTQATIITLDCEDQEPHPVEQETLYWRFSLWPDGWNGEPSYSNWYSTPHTEFPVEISFEEDSWHDLEYYCVDHLGNEEEHHVQYYIVDTKPPIIEKNIVGPYYGDCPPEDEEDECYIDTETEIHVDAVDQQPHPVNDVKCDYSVKVCEGFDGGGGCGEGVVSNLTPPFIIKLPEESTHELTIRCWDALGNSNEDIETFIVDKTPPVTSKEYRGPYKYHDGVEWINSETLVVLSAHDEAGPHVSGVKATYWRNTLVDDRYCWVEEGWDCEDAQGLGEWNLYTEPFTKPEQSCHLIEYYSVDNVNKTEDVKKQCVFVDNTPPTPNKTVGEPKTEWDGSDSVFYPEETERCWNNEENEIECWKVTLMTPITLDCEDQGPHPVEQEHVCFNVEVDAEDETGRYCDPRFYNGEMNDGYCCVEDILEDFMFLEETEHNLKYYCVDYLGNSNEEDVDEEKFKVEGTRFEIPLYEKWNLISVPVVLLNDDPEEVFKDTENITSVWTYDPGHIICGQDWCVWSPNPSPDNLRIQPGWGYWVLAEDDDLLVIGGSLMSPATTPPTRNLVAGWNLIGHYGLISKPAYCSLFSLIDTTIGYPRWSALWGFDALTDEFIPLDVSGETNPGEGYWLEMDIPDLYAPSTTCWWGLS